MEDIFHSVTDNLITFGPFLLLYFFANISEKWRIHSLQPTVDVLLQEEARNRARGIRILLTIIVLGMYGILMLGTLISTYLPVGDKQQMDPQNGVTPLTWLLLGSLMFVPWIRKWIAKGIPIHPDHFIHTLSLSLSCLLIYQYHFVLIIGIKEFGEFYPSGQNHVAELISLWTQDLLFVLLALIGVGWLTRRNLKVSLKRLGIVKPNGKTILLGIGFGIILFVLAYSLEHLAYYTDFLFNPEVNKLTEKIYGPFVSSVAGMISIGLAAGLGEEALFRGAMQPRFGIGLTSILFTVVHANYGFSIITIIIFLLALALGFLRNRYSTTLTMITHASYNIITSVVSNLMS